MKLLFQITFLLLCLYDTGYGQLEQDPAAKSILESIKAEYDSYTSLFLEFDLIIEIPNNQSENQKGKIIQKSNQYKIELDDQSIYCNGSIVWLHLKANNEVQINDYEEDSGDDMMSPQAILKIYDSGEYQYALTNEFKENGQNVQQIEFKPLDPDSEYSKIRLTITRNNKKMKRIKVFAKDGSRFTMKVKKEQANLTLEDQLFVFDSKKFPGIHVEDLRL